MVDDGRAPVVRLLRAAAVVHPFPSLLNAGLVFALALVAGGSAFVASGLALAMLGLQFSIGAFNDLCDAELDALSKPGKPIAAGHITRAAAARVATIAGGGGLLAAAAYGVPELLLALTMLACGLAYDAKLKRGPFGWVCLSIALPLLPVFAWYGAAGTMPPRSELLLPLAATAGPALQLANGLVDLERDRVVGITPLAARLGRPAGLVLMSVIQALIHTVAWLVLLGGEPAGGGTWLVLSAAGALAFAGLCLSATVSPARREWGWRAQAIGLALLALAWLAAVGNRGSP